MERRWRVVVGRAAGGTLGRQMRSILFAFGLAACSILAAACGGSSGNNGGGNDSTGDDGGGGPTTGDDASGAPDAPGDDAGDAGSTAPHDSGPPAPGIDASYPNDPTDGPPTRQACTGSFGAALNTDHGRLDGTLVSIVPSGFAGKTCNGDSSHLHLQMLVNGSIYDVAVNLDTFYFEEDRAIPDGAFAEGWHTTDALDYPNLGIHSSQFTQPPSQQALASILESALANANHLAIFATGYGPDGIHDVHRRGGGGNDGAIVIDPLSATSHVFFFCFNTDNF